MNWFNTAEEALSVLLKNFDLTDLRIRKHSSDYVPLGIERLAIDYLVRTTGDWIPHGWTSDVQLRPAVYLAGKIANCDDAQCGDWRAVAKALLQDTVDVLDPMVRDMRGVSMTEEQDRWLIRMDKADIAACMGVVFRADDGPSWGTAMEMHFASTLLRHCNVVFTGTKHKTSPWVRAHADHLCETVEDACVYVRTKIQQELAKDAICQAT